MARRLRWLEDYAARGSSLTSAARGLPPAADSGLARGLPPAVLRSGITLWEISFGYPPDGDTVLGRVGVHLPALLPGQPAMALNASGPAFAFDEAAMRLRVAPALLALRQQLCPTQP